MVGVHYCCVRDERTDARKQWLDGCGIGVKGVVIIVPEGGIVFGLVFFSIPFLMFALLFG